MRTRSGTISQGALRFQASDYADKHIYYPVLGIVLNVYASDDDLNRSSNVAYDGRGTQVEARVLVVNDGSDSPWILPSVVVTPRGSSGFDNFSEEIPKGVTGSIDESLVKSSLQDISVTKLDGDWCVVSFIGGSINQPFMTCWWPHAANTRDNLTSGVNGSLKQARRLVRRFQGTRMAVTSSGTVLLDTSEADQPFRNGQRAPSASGGHVRVTVKDSAQLELNWNPAVLGDPDEPDFLWPPNAQPNQQRAVANTKIMVTKDLIDASAGKDVKVTAQQGDMTLTAKNNAIIAATQTLLGAADAVEAVIKGTGWAAASATLLSALGTWVTAVAAAIAAAPITPPSLQAAVASATPTLSSAITSFNPNSHLSQAVKTK